MTGLTELKLLTRAQLEKAAIDSGFDVSGVATSNLMSFRSSHCPLKIWLGTTHDANPVVGFSMANVAAEMDHPLISAPFLVDGCHAWMAAADFVTLDRLLTRAFSLSRALPNQLLEAWDTQVKLLSTTERESVVRQRVGQELFRGGLLALWSGRCVVTGLDDSALLRASHAKPWKDSNDAERLDVYNGLLLAAHLDAAFDQGLITFGENGTVIPSPALSPISLEVLGLVGSMPTILLRAQNQPYMEWHRTHVFRK